MATSISSGVRPILERPTRSRITGTHLYQLMRCERAVYLEWFGNPDCRVPPDAVTELLFRRGLELEKSVVEALGYPEPDHAPGDMEEGARRTMELLGAGVPGVSQAVLLWGDLLGIPDLLRREEGGSDLGPFHYVVGDIKSSRRGRGDQWMQVAFYSELLAHLQGRFPSYGYLVLGDGSESRMPLGDLRHRCLEAVEEIRELLAGPPPRLRLRRECDRCHWRDLCGDQARKTDDLSRLPGFHEGLAVELERRGIASGEQLASLSREEVRKVPGLLRPYLGCLARARGRPLVHKPPRLPRGEDHSFVTLLRDPFLERVLLLGWLDWRGRHEVWVPRGPEEEATAKKALLGALWSLEGPVFHGGGNPGPHLLEGGGGAAPSARLPSDPAPGAQGPGPGSWPPVDHRLVDLLEVVRGSVVLPGRRQDLRAAAGVLEGFEDLAGEPEGMPMVWWDLHQRTKDPAWLETIREQGLKQLRLLAALHRWLRAIEEDPGAAPEGGWE